MLYRMHAAPTRMLFGYDPLDLPANHLAWLVEQVVEEALQNTATRKQKGQPAFNPRLCAKVLIYGYATGIRSSRQLEKQCRENLPFLLLTRGDAPSYRTLCYFRVNHPDLIEEVWVSLFAVAKEMGMQRLGRIVVDSSKILADAGPESVVKANEYEGVLNTLKTILQEALEADSKEEEAPSGTVYLEKEVPQDHLREILRAIRKNRAQRKPQEQAGDAICLGPRMKPRLQQAIKTLQAAQEAGLKHACLTDPDARMMGEGRDKPIKECHSYEIAVDQDCGLLVVGQVTQETDHSRLEPLVCAAKKQEPGGIVSLDADSGYYKGEVIARLEEQGIQTCVPDGFTAKKLRTGALAEDFVAPSNPMALRYDPQQDVFVCAAGKRLVRHQVRLQGGRNVQTYRAEQACTGCPLAPECFDKKKDGVYRTTSRAVDATHPIDTALARFKTDQHQQRYRNRGKTVETVFGFLRHILGYSRWMVRGTPRVCAESALFTAAYQFRKVYCVWKQA